MDGTCSCRTTRAAATSESDSRGLRLGGLGAAAAAADHAAWRASLQEQGEAQPTKALRADWASCLAKTVVVCARYAGQPILAVASHCKIGDATLPYLQALRRVLDDAVSGGNGSHCNIICTQPRRIAAMNIAKRVALEIGERVGDTIGYHVGMDSRVSPRTRVIFMTTGIFLMRMVNNPESLEKYTHLIMDEVHERDLDIDFSLVVIKHLLCQIMSRPDKTPLNFKLLLMSATFNTELFTNYFSKSSITGVERVDAYKGVAERYKRMEQEKKDRLAAIWGPAKQSDWEYHTNAQPKSNKPSVSVKDDDEWVEDRGQHRHVMPVA